MDVTCAEFAIRVLVRSAESNSNWSYSQRLFHRGNNQGVITNGSNSKLSVVKPLSGHGQNVILNTKGGAVYNNIDLWINNNYCPLSRGTMYILPENSLQSTDPTP